MRGFFNKRLTVDLTNRTFSVSEIEDGLFERLLGGKGLGTCLLNEFNPRGVDPFSPGNRFILATGPVVDTPVHGCSRYGVYTKSPLTGLYAEAYSGGRAAIPMSRCGFDAIILEGASDSPVYLGVTPSGVTFHDARSLWGKGTYETEDTILREVNAKGARAIVIGPAGENLVKYAVVENEKWRSAGRTGVGAVLGSKKIKGLAFHGDQRRMLADPEGTKAFAREILQKHKDTAPVQAFRNYGTSVMVGILNNAGSFPNQYWNAGVMEGWEALSADTLHHEHQVKPRACPNCFIACSRYTTINKGRHQGLTIEGPEYETIYAFGGLCLIKDIGEVTYLNDLCDNLGLDTITSGNVIAFLMEATARGVSKCRVRYGDADRAAELLNDIAQRRGIGALLAEGVKAVAQEWGCKDLAIHVKGLEPAGYDPRSLPGMGLAYATSERGACHARTTFYKAELAGISPPDELEGKAAHFIEFEDRMSLMDALILCRFYRDLYSWEDYSTILRLTTGMDVDRKDLENIARNIKSEARTFNLREGATRADDTLPSRFFQESLKDSGKAYARDTFDRLMSDYYSLRGWGKD